MPTPVNPPVPPVPPNTTNPPIPTIGRVVHYVAYGTPGGEFPAGVCRASTITEVDPIEAPPDTVGLCVMNPSGLFFNRHIPYDPDKKPGTWHWPERA